MSNAVVKVARTLILEVIGDAVCKFTINVNIMWLFIIRIHAVYDAMSNIKRNERCKQCEAQ